MEYSTYIERTINAKQRGSRRARALFRLFLIFICSGAPNQVHAMEGGDAGPVKDPVAPQQVTRGKRNIKGKGGRPADSGGPQRRRRKVSDASDMVGASTVPSSEEKASHLLQPGQKSADFPSHSVMDEEYVKALNGAFVFSTERGVRAVDGGSAGQQPSMPSLPASDVPSLAQKTATPPKDAFKVKAIQPGGTPSGKPVGRKLTFGGSDEGDKEVDEMPSSQPLPDISGGHTLTREERNRAGMARSASLPTTSPPEYLRIETALQTRGGAPQSVRRGAVAGAGARAEKILVFDPSITVDKPLSITVPAPKHTLYADGQYSKLFIDELTCGAYRVDQPPMSHTDVSNMVGHFKGKVKDCLLTALHTGKASHLLEEPGRITEKVVFVREIISKGYATEDEIKECVAAYLAAGVYLCASAMSLAAQPITWKDLGCGAREPFSRHSQPITSDLGRKLYSTDVPRNIEYAQMIARLLVPLLADLDKEMGFDRYSDTSSLKTVFSTYAVASLNLLREEFGGSKAGSKDGWASPATGCAPSPSDMPARRGMYYWQGDDNDSDPVYPASSIIERLYVNYARYKIAELSKLNGSGW